MTFAQVLKAFSRSTHIREVFNLGFKNLIYLKNTDFFTKSFN